MKVILKTLLFLMIVNSIICAEKIKLPETLKVAVLRDFPPQYSVNAEDTPIGFAIDVIDEISKISGFNIEYVVKDSWQEMFDAIKSGEADLIPNQGITERRKKNFSFSKPVETFQVFIFTLKKNNTIINFSSLKNKRVGVIKLNVGEAIVKQDEEIIAVKHDCVNDALVNLLSGSIDAIIFPEPVLMRKARAAGLDDRIKTVGLPLREILRGISVDKSKEYLIDDLNKAIDAFIGSQKYTEIYEKWYGVPTPYWTSGRVAKYMTMLLIVVIFLMGFWKYYTTIKLIKDLKTENALRRKVEAELQSSYDTLEDKVQERTQELEKAVNQVKTLSGLLPICSHCKKVRDDNGYWQQIEEYIDNHSEATFSHSICKECAEKYYPELDLYDKE